MHDSTEEKPSEAGRAIRIEGACRNTESCVREQSSVVAVTGTIAVERPQFELLADPLYGWVTGCPTYDPLATFFTPLVYATGNATHDA